jgi:hypothetical protein
MDIIQMSQVLKYQSVLIFNIHFIDRCNIRLPKQLTFVFSLARELRSVPHCVESYFEGQEMVELP